MALTKFQIKISREEYNLISRVVSYAVASVYVEDLPTLFEKETLEQFKVRFESKQFKLQERFSFSFTASELFIFIKHVGTLMQKMGEYEKAVYRMLYDQQLAMQVSRAVQVRINYTQYK